MPDPTGEPLMRPVPCIAIANKSAAITRYAPALQAFVILPLVSAFFAGNGKVPAVPIVVNF